MSKAFVEELLRFEFGKDWHVIKYDEHADYVGRIGHLPETKAVDFVAVYLVTTLFLIEVKDFRGYRIKNQGRIKEGELAIEVAQKVRDTIAGMIAAQHRGNGETWDRYTQCLTSTEPPVRVLLWLEDDLPPGPRGRRQNNASVMTDALKRHLRWLTTKVFVASLALGSPDGITVTNLPARVSPRDADAGSDLLMLEVLLEDNHCLAINKPAGLLAQGDETGEPSLLELAGDYLRQKYAKPGNVFVGLVHRLDRPTSGVILLARTSKGAERLSRQFREGTVRKVYRAVVEGVPESDSGEWEDRLLKDEVRNVVQVVAAGEKEARLAYRVMETKAGLTTLELVPTTGRSHQLRVQLASRGLAIVGDRKYGAKSTLMALDGRPRVALHALELTFTHPTRPESITVTAPLPPDWPRSW